MIIGYDIYDQNVLLATTNFLLSAVFYLKIFFYLENVLKQPRSDGG
jgi:hypothetical protein